MTPPKPELPPDYVNADLQFVNSMVLMHAICRIHFLEHFEKELAPGIAKELQRRGVDFSRALGGERDATK